MKQIRRILQLTESLVVLVVHEGRAKELEPETIYASSLQLLDILTGALLTEMPLETKVNCVAKIQIAGSDYVVVGASSD